MTVSKKKNTRQRRLNKAKSWITKYNGKNIFKGYRKKFKVDWNCAFIELEMLGIKIDPEYKKQVLETIKRDAVIKKQKKNKEN